MPRAALYRAAFLLVQLGSSSLQSSKNENNENGKDAPIDGPISFILFFFLVVPFILINITAYRKERRKADEDLQALLKENNNLLRELLAKMKQ
jgi:pilus assembly protein TadC